MTEVKPNLSKPFEEAVILPDDPECGTYETYARAARILQGLNTESEPVPAPQPAGPR